MTTIAPSPSEPSSPSTGRRPATAPGASGAELLGLVRAVLNRRPCVGFAMGVVRDGSLEWFHGHGLADIASHAPVTQDTAFRIGSITKTVTAIAVMQLWEEGLVDLDASANEYLRAYRLVPAQASFRPATVRDLLTHTAGIPEVRRVADLFHPSWGPFDARPPTLSVKAGKPMPTLGEYYRDGLRIVSEPGTAFAYSNHGFATLGQIVEDVTNTPLERYLRERVFDPLGMTHTDLVRSERVRSRLATGYVLRRSGAGSVPDRDWIGAGAGEIYATTGDMARYVAALLRGGSNEHGSVLRPATLRTMFAPHYQPDPRLPGMGLGFFRSDPGGHHVIGHEGVLPGFNSLLLAAPDDGVGVVAFTNGSSGAFTWLPLEMEPILRRLIGVTDEVVRPDVPHHPEIWGELCGRYQLPPRISDLRGRLAMAGGAEVFVRGGRLTMRVLTPVPALYHGLPLEPYDEDDPSAFRLDLTRFGMGTIRVVFEHVAGVGTTAAHTDIQSISLYRRPAGPKLASRRAVAAGLLATGSVIALRRRAVSGRSRP